MKQTIVSLIVLYLLCFSAEDDATLTKYNECNNHTPSDASPCAAVKINDDYTCCFLTNGNGNPSKGSVKKCKPIENAAISKDLNAYATYLYNNDYTSQIKDPTTATDQDLIDQFGKYELTCNDQTGTATVDADYFKCIKADTSSCTDVKLNGRKCCFNPIKSNNNNCIVYSDDDIKNLKNILQLYYEEDLNPRRLEVNYKNIGFSDDFIKKKIKLDFITKYSDIVVDCGGENKVTIDTYTGVDCLAEAPTKTATKSHSLSTKFCPLLFIALLLLIV